MVLVNWARVVSTKWLDTGADRSAGILPAHAAKMAALRCPCGARLDNSVKPVLEK